MVCLPDGENILKICLFVLTQSTNVDRHTHRHTATAWRHRPRLCISSRGKNRTTVIYIIQRERLIQLSVDYVNKFLNWFRSSLAVSLTAVAIWRSVSQKPDPYDTFTKLNQNLFNLNKISEIIYVQYFNWTSVLKDTVVFTAVYQLKRLPSVF